MGKALLNMFLFKINFGLLAFFRLIFDQGVCLGCANFYGLVFFGLIF